MIVEQNSKTFISDTDPDTNLEFPNSNIGNVFINTNPNVSPGTGKLFVSLDNSPGIWGGLGFYDSANNFWWGRGVYGSSTQPGSVDNICIGLLSGRLISSGSFNITMGGSAGQSLTEAQRCILIGTGAGQSIASDFGHVFIGYNAGNAQSVVSPAFSSGGGFWSVVIGDNCAPSCIEIASSVIIGRGAAFRGTTLFNDSTIVGHGAAFYADNITSITAVGNQAAGNPTDGTGANFGLGSLGDTFSVYLGDFSGKASNAARTNVMAIGCNATVGVKDNTFVLGHGVEAGATSARFYSLFDQNDLNSSTGATIPAATLVGGEVSRTGSPSAPFTDVTDTAANIIAAGPGNGVEADSGVIIYYTNKTSEIATITGGTGVTISGTATIPPGPSTWFVKLTNTAVGSETVTLIRVGA